MVVSDIRMALAFCNCNGIYFDPCLEFLFYLMLATEHSPTLHSTACQCQQATAKTTGRLQSIDQTGLRVGPVETTNSTACCVNLRQPLTSSSRGVGGWEMRRSFLSPTHPQQSPLRHCLRPYVTCKIKAQTRRVEWVVVLVLLGYSTLVVVERETPAFTLLTWAYSLTHSTFLLTLKV